MWFVVRVVPADGTSMAKFIFRKIMGPAIELRADWVVAVSSLTPVHTLLKENVPLHRHKVFADL